MRVSNVHLDCPSFCLCIAVGAMLTMLVYLVMFLKLWSYTDVNRWCRRDREKARKLAKKTGKGDGKKNSKSAEESASPTVDSKDHPLVQYPDNLNIPGMLAFIVR